MSIPKIDASSAILSANICETLTDTEIIAEEASAVKSEAVEPTAEEIFLTSIVIEKNIKDFTRPHAHVPYLVSFFGRGLSNLNALTVRLPQFTSVVLNNSQANHNDLKRLFIESIHQLITKKNKDALNDLFTKLTDINDIKTLKDILNNELTKKLFVRLTLWQAQLKQVRPDLLSTTFADLQPEACPLCPKLRYRVAVLSYFYLQLSIQYIPTFIGLSQKKYRDATSSQQLMRSTIDFVINEINASPHLTRSHKIDILATYRALLKETAEIDEHFTDTFNLIFNDDLLHNYGPVICSLTTSNIANDSLNDADHADCDFTYTQKHREIYSNYLDRVGEAATWFKEQAQRIGECNSILMGMATYLRFGDIETLNKKLDADGLSVKGVAKVLKHEVLAFNERSKTDRELQRQIGSQAKELSAPLIIQNELRKGYQICQEYVTYMEVVLYMHEQAQKWSHAIFYEPPVAHPSAILSKPKTEKKVPQHTSAPATKKKEC